MLSVFRMLCVCFIVIDLLILRATSSTCVNAFIFVGSCCVKFCEKYFMM